jgi:hypothetical protein
MLERVSTGDATKREKAQNKAPAFRRALLTV